MERRKPGFNSGGVGVRHRTSRQKAVGRKQQPEGGDSSQVFLLPCAYSLLLSVMRAPELRSLSSGSGRRPAADSVFAPPEFNRSVKTARGEIMTVWTEGHGGDGFQMPFQRARLKP